MMQPTDSADLRKRRGAFFTPYDIARHLADWALRGQDNHGVILDPTCGEGVFLLAAADQLATIKQLYSAPQFYGVDIHKSSLNRTSELLAEAGAPPAKLFNGDFFSEPTPDQLDARIPHVDAVLGNPPFVRYQEHRGDQRRRALSAALAQGVRLSGLASSWAALLVHASAFLKPNGRIAMVLPAELLSVGYAEPIRVWLRNRFQAVHLVLFDRLQFADAEEQVVLLVARGTGGCSAFSLHHVASAEELQHLHIFDADAFAPRSSGKWTDLLIPEEARNLFTNTVEKHFRPLGSVATVELGTVTGANKFFTLSEGTRKEYGLAEFDHVVRCVPPGGRHVRGPSLTQGRWEQLRLAGERVWLLNPRVRRVAGGGLDRYLLLGEELKVQKAYKCSIRNPWWKPPVVREPDYFFTYMSHVSPRLISNDAKVTLVNSMHGVRLQTELSMNARLALPILSLNTITRLGGELFGRAYGGGILKMEPTEAATLPIPAIDSMETAWHRIGSQRLKIANLLENGHWAEATDIVDQALLAKTLGIHPEVVTQLRQVLARQTAHRQRKAADGFS